MITTVQKQYTVKDYKHLEEGDPHQLINGDFIMREPSPTYGHQGVVGDILTQIRMHLLKKNIGEVRVSPIDVYLDNHNVMQPDIVFVNNKKKHIVKDDGLHGAPDMVIEILSPSTRYYDTNVKKTIYEKHEVKEYWLIDPKENEVMGFENINGKFQKFYQGYGKFTSKVLNLEISIIL